MAVCLTEGTGTCAHCGRTDVGSPAAGYATLNELLLCNPKASGRPNCFVLVTVYGHPSNCRCEQQYPIAGSREATTWA